MKDPEIMEAIRQAGEHARMEQALSKRDSNFADQQKVLFAQALAALGERFMSKSNDVVTLTIERKTAHVARRKLLSLVENREQVATTVKRKKTLRPSEKAVWLVELEEQTELLNHLSKQIADALGIKESK